MGKGSFDGQHFKLFATFDFNATAGLIAKWRCTLQAASNALFFATDGQMSIGTVIASNGRLGKDKADIVITDTPGQSVTIGRLQPEKPFRQTILRSDEVMHPGVVVHELGHYLLALEDEYLEYVDPITIDGHCSSGPPHETSCIMEYSGLGDVISSHATCSVTNGSVRQFCCATNHTAHNNQQVFNGKSCWETIIERWGAGGSWGNFPSIIGPVAGSRPNGVPVGSKPADIEWQEVSTRTRLICLVGDEHPADAAYADFLRLFLGPLSLIEKSLQLRFLVPAAHVNRFSLALNNTLAELQKSLDVRVESQSVVNLYRELEGPPASNQRIVLYGSPAAEIKSYLVQETNRYVTDVSNAGYFTHGISETTQFQEIAFQTNGQNRLLLSGTASSVRVRNTSQFMATAFECLEPWAMLDNKAATFPGPITSTSADAQRFSAADLRRIRKRDVSVELTPNQYDFPVYVEAEATQVAFAVNAPADAKVWLYIRRPSGTLVDPQSPAVVFYQQDEYQLYVIRATKREALQGQWTMRLERSSASAPTPFQLRAYCNNPQLGLHLQVTRLTETNTFHLAVAVRFDNLPVANLGPLYAHVSQMAPSGETLSTQIVQLTQSTATIDTSEDRSYTGRFVRSASGTASIRVAIQNVGQAVQMLPPPDPSSPRPNSARPIPNFNRVLESTIGW